MNPESIKLLRERLNLTQRAFASALGVSKQSISQYETGFRKPGPTLLVLLFVLNSLPKKKSLELVALLQKASSTVGLKKKEMENE